jgi:hypothetical protein
MECHESWFACSGERHFKPAFDFTEPDLLLHVALIMKAEDHSFLLLRRHAVVRAARMESSAPRSSTHLGRS